MKYTPHTAHACMILSALDEIAHFHRDEIPENHAAQVKSDVAAHLATIEEKGIDHAASCPPIPSGDSLADYKLVNRCAASLLYQWVEALSQNKTEKASQIEQQYDTLISKHPFPYQRTKDFFNRYGYPPLASTSEAKKNYRPPSGQDFGIIRNTVSASAKIGIIGDWGTGTDDAKFLLKSMLLNHPEMEVILHLGDIYQSGTAFECEQNFLKPIRETFEDAEIKNAGIKRLPIFTIPGNHEYFSGAKSYFEMLNVLNAELADPKWTQEASFFCLRSSDKKWQFLGADTGLGCIADPNQPGLEPDEAQWHYDRLSEFSGKSIFMTHHQLVSAQYYLNSSSHLANADLGYYNKNLLSQFKDQLEKIDLWIWGHDHWFVPFTNNLTIPTGSGCEPVLKRGQLLGGSAREHASHSQSHNDGKIKYTDAVQKNKNGYILPTTSGKSPYSDHTYGVFDLQAETVSYFQTGAWADGSTENKTAPTSPLHVEDLA